MPAFRYFVILAGMRTGSNLLEEHLASAHGIDMWGELFNPHFFGKPRETHRFDHSMDDRDADPIATLERMIDQSEGLPGFRLFQDHDPRVFDHVLADETCGKVILTRRAVDSFVSLQIARATGQWWLGDVRSAKSAKVRFDASAYADFVEGTNAHALKIDQALQTSGQAAFRLSYDDLGAPGAIAGLVRYLGLKSTPDASAIRARVQNPTPIAQRLTNPEDARATLSAEAADIGNPPIHEPDRGPGVRFFHAAPTAPLLYMPIRGAWDDPVPSWLTEIDGGVPLTGLNQRDLRRWKRQHPGHLSFTVLRHPLPRAHDAFCRHILPNDQDNYADIRNALIRRFNVPLPSEWHAAAWSLDDHRAAFLGFLRFLTPNLGGQTSLRVDNTWASQERLLSAIAQLVVPDRVLREETLSRDLTDLAGIRSLENAAPNVTERFDPYALADVVTKDIEKAAVAAYRRDYMMFGFGRWMPPVA